MGRGLVRCAVTASVVLALAACGGDKATPVKTAGASTTATTDGPPATNAAGKPHFDTPDAAMRYLAAAWNANDLVKLKHVTDPSARDQLNAMHGVAINLRLDHCDFNDGRGDYTCHFDHDFPPHASTTMAIDHANAPGEAVFVVGPADTPGWYMTVFESCS